MSFISCTVPTRCTGVLVLRRGDLELVCLEPRGDRPPCCTPGCPSKSTSGLGDTAAWVDRLEDRFFLAIRKYLVLRPLRSRCNLTFRPHVRVRVRAGRDRGSESVCCSRYTWLMHRLVTKSMRRVVLLSVLVCSTVGRLFRQMADTQMEADPNVNDNSYIILVKPERREGEQCLQLADASEAHTITKIEHVVASEGAAAATAGAAAAGGEKRGYNEAPLSFDGLFSPGIDKVRVTFDDSATCELRPADLVAVGETTALTDLMTSSEPKAEPPLKVTTEGIPEGAIFVGEHPKTNLDAYKVYVHYHEGKHLIHAVPKKVDRSAAKRRANAAAEARAADQQPAKRPDQRPPSDGPEEGAAADAAAAPPGAAADAAKRPGRTRDRSDDDPLPKKAPKE